METHFVIVEEAGTMSLLYAILKKLNSSFHIQCFDTLTSALNNVMNTPTHHHIVFLGVEIHQTSSIAMAKQLMRKVPSTKIIFLANNDAYALDALSVHAYGYIIKPINIEKIKKEIFELTNFTMDKTRIQICTFGSFDIFINQVPIAFSRKKSKEILAYLVDRHGVYVTRKEIASILWEDGVYTRKRQNYLQILMSDLQKDLRKVQAEHMIRKGHNRYAIDPSTFTCDLYQLMEGNQNARPTYCGEYMTNYSWAKLNKYIRMKMHI